MIMVLELWGGRGGCPLRTVSKIKIKELILLKGTAIGLVPTLHTGIHGLSLHKKIWFITPHIYYYMTDPSTFLKSRPIWDMIATNCYIFLPIIPCLGTYFPPIFLTRVFLGAYK